MRKNQNTSGRTKQLTKPSSEQGRKRLPRKRGHEPHFDLASLLSIDHACGGCKTGEKCCCATYEVCVTFAEMKRIIRVLPEAVKLCPHLGTDAGFDNVFEEAGQGLFAIDTTEDGLCLFAFMSNNRIRCSLHAAASTLGLPLEQVKPKACLLWPMTFSEGKEVLSLTEDALSFSCNSRINRKSRRLSPSLTEALSIVYGRDFGTTLEKEARRGHRVQR